MASIRLSGFTIVELIISIAIIGILASLGLVVYSGIQAQSVEVSILSDIDVMDGIQTHYGLQNDVSGKNYYSVVGYDTELSFTPSRDNIIDVAIDSSDYCIRGYNPVTSYDSIGNAAIKESNPGVCSTIGPYLGL